MILATLLIITFEPLAVLTDSLSRHPFDPSS